MKKVFLLLALLFFSGNISARDYTDTTIVKVRPTDWNVGGAFIGAYGGVISGPATCDHPTSPSNWYFLRKDHPVFKELLSVALSANLTRRTVIIRGNGVCTAAAYEGVSSIELQ